MIGKIVALINHPVMRAIVDTGQYAVRTHIMPALSKTQTTETKAEEYAYEEPDIGMQGGDEEGTGGVGGERPS